MVGLDTSVVVRLLVGEPAHQAGAARRLLREADEPVCLSDLVVGEAYFALRHHYHVPHRKAAAALRALLADGQVHPTGVARDVFESMGTIQAVPGLMDRLIHGDYRHDGADLLTFDRDVARLVGARLIQG